MHVLVEREGLLALCKAGSWRRLLALLQAGRLDRDLARGAAPEARLGLAVRAMRLTSAPYRQAIGRNLLLLTASDPAPDIESLAQALLGTEPVPARAVAIISQLIADGGGPLYRRTGGDELHVIIRQASRAMHETQPAAR